MPHHEHKKCERCGIFFECKAGSIAQCECSSIILSEEERAYIAGKYSDCICIRCLKVLQQECNANKTNKHKGFE